MLKPPRLNRRHWICPGCNAAVPPRPAILGEIHPDRDGGTYLLITKPWDPATETGVIVTSTRRPGQWLVQCTCGWVTTFEGSEVKMRRATVLIQSQ